MSDIIFDSDVVAVNGHCIKGQVCDLMLDSPNRRISNAGVRRALVHDFNDRLTINYDGDYPNGVQIKGTLVVDQLHVRGHVGFAAGIHTNGISVGSAPEPPLIKPGEPSGGGEVGLDLVASLEHLAERVKMLEEKVAALQAGHR